MRSGVFISAASHAILVALTLFGTPKLFDAASIASIEVDLVRSDEIETPPEKPTEKPKDEKPPDWNPLPEKSTPQAAAAPASQSKPPPANPQTALGPQIPSPGVTPQPPAQPSIFDPANIPALLNLPNAPDKSFDSEATTVANLSDEDRATLKAQIKKCWKLPAGMSAAQTTRVVLRLNLRRDGSLAADPLLIEASASRDGPLLLQTAMRALKECQPYGFLPADKYREWRLLDLSFSPRDMAGG
jgi:outer membrane biosynthesis protein TonB